MPKIVDHDERRRSLIEATWRVIAREGIASATTRGIAREAGCSSGVLAHYFADKAELMASAMLAAHAEVHARLDPELTGLASVRQYMLECLPLDERRRFLAVVEVSFWGQAVGNPRLVELYADEVEGFRGKLRRPPRAGGRAGGAEAGGRRRGGRPRAARPQRRAEPPGGAVPARRPGGAADRPGGRHPRPHPPRRPLTACVECWVAVAAPGASARVADRNPALGVGGAVRPGRRRTSGR